MPGAAACNGSAAAAGEDCAGGGSRQVGGAGKTATLDVSETTAKASMIEAGPAEAGMAEAGMGVPRAARIGAAAAGAADVFANVPLQTDVPAAGTRLGFGQAGLDLAGADHAAAPALEADGQAGAASDAEALDAPRQPRAERREAISWDAAIEAELRRGRTIRELDPPLRDAFEAEHGAARREELIAVTTTGLLIYLPLVLCLNALVAADSSWVDVGLQCTVTPLLALSLAHWAFLRQRRAAAREWGAAAVASCFSISAVVAVARCPHATALPNFFLVGVPVFGALMLARLRFLQATGFVVVSALALGMALVWRSDLAVATRLYPLGFLVVASLPALGGVYRQQTMARLAYLREKQQALRIQALTSENGRLSALSATDAVTGAANRRHLENVLTAICGSDATGDFLLLADIDHFKRFNDRHGHLAGDACLRLVTETMRRQIRRGDVLARYGGEEFAIVLSRTTRADSLATAERIRADVAGQDVLVNGAVETITISLGVAERQRGDTAAMLIAAADIGLYQAKRAGRNCVREARIGMPVLT